jgi:WD40 repeat protein
LASASWLEDEQASLILASQLAEDASTWRNNGDDPSFLYRGTQLAGLQQAARTWAADPDRYPRLISPQPEFLHASERAATRSARRARTRVTALIISLIVALSGLGIAAVADSSANQQRNDAITSQLAAQSELLDATDPVTAAQLAAAAQGIAPTFEARTSMLDVLAQPERAVLSSSGDIPLTGSVSVNAVAFSPDGKILAAAYNDGTARLWDVATHHQIGMPLIAHGDVAAVAFSPDGEILATADGDGARLWDVATHRQIGAFIIDSSPVTFNSQGRSSYRDVSGVVFSPDGDILATGDGNGTAQLWDVATHRQIGASMTVNPRGGIGVSAVAFSPDGDILATANGDGARLWDVATQRQIGAPIIGSSGVVKSAPMIAVAFSPDGTLLATSELGGPVQLWNVVTHQQIGASFDNSDEIYGVAFSPGGTTMATAERGAARLWNVDIYRQIGASMTTGGSTIAGVAFNSHGTILATWSDDGGYGGAELWDVATHRQIGTPMTVGDQGVSEAPFHPDGTILATATVDGTARLWDVATHHQIGSPLKDSHGQSVTAIAFSPNGKILATADLDGITQLWDVATHRQIGAVITASHDLEISGLAFSPDGKILATGGWDGTARLWSVATHRQIGTPMIAGGFVEVAFSSDGKILATGGNDAVLCNVATHDQIGTPMAEDGSDVSVALNPQGTILATWNYLGQADLWDVATHSQIGPAIIPGGPGGGGVAFSPNGNILATGGNDATLLNVAFPRNLLPEVCSLAGRPLTLQQWNTFVQSIPYQQECSQYQSPRTESMPASGCDDRRLLKHNI